MIILYFILAFIWAAARTARSLKHGIDRLGYFLKEFLLFPLCVLQALVSWVIS